MDYDPLADLYQRQYQHYRDDVHFYARLCEREQATHVLELGAGAGRISVALARRGMAVTGLELSSAMIERGKAFAAAENVEVNWVQADMRSFELQQKFPLVIAPFNALMHLYTLEDQDKTLMQIDKHLEPGGVLAFDLYQPHFGPRGVLRHEGETFFDADGSRIDVMLHQNIDACAQLVTTTYFVDTTSGNNSLKREVLELRQRYFNRFELERWLQNAGYRTEVQGDFAGARLNEHSPHFVVTARR